MMRRSVVRRLNAALARIEPLDVPLATGGRLPTVLDRVDEAVEQTASRLDEAGAAAARLESALHEVAQGVVICDEQGRVVFRNRQAAAFVGARHGDALAERSLAELLESAVRGQSRTETLELFGPPRRALKITASPLDDGRRTVGAVAVVEDITERRRVDSIRRDFVANISHELKTPVGALGLVAETLAGEDDPEVVRRLATRMQDEAIRLGRIIDDLLDLSRIEDEGEPRREPLPVHLVVAQAAERVRPLAEHRSIRVVTEEPPVDMRVSGDRRQLVSALNNLLENAVKYSDCDSSVEIAVDVADDLANGATPGAGEGGHWVDIHVRDHGIGIPARDLDRIFERFYRVDRARARDTGGTGLGLAIVRHVADNHGGRVFVTSQEGEGSTFTLRLPAVPADAPGNQRQAITSDRRGDG